ncbi:universal stress protein [Natronoarchaeum sp. GCM10025703]|uniref:universal stress protein n=1 Tax=unclassified Natronoarchaeum TaxID=2620183 RepID=UPI00361DAB50
MYHILVALDDTLEHAIAQANAIVEMPHQPGDIEVTLLHVFTDNVTGASIQQLETALKSEELLEDAGIDVQLDETSGDPATQIIEYADETDANLISVGGRKRSPTGKALFGSVTQDVVLTADLPVLVCGETNE